MVNSEPADAAADAAREALRGLAHATRSIAEPSESYPVLGSLHAGLASLRQALVQLADLHDCHAPLAATTDLRQLGGEVAAEIAAGELREAATLLDRAYGRVAAAWSHNGRIVWHPEPPGSPPDWTPGGPSRRLAPPTSFAGPTAPRDSGPLAR